jgi:hypothetical protein
MNAVPFDTLKLARGLEAAGLAGPVAAGTASALAEALGGADLATKTDLAMMESKVMGAIAALDAKVTGSIGALDTKVTGSIGALDTKVTGSIGALDTKFDNKFVSLEARFDAKLELLRRDMTIKLGGMIFVATGVLLAAMRLMPHP